MPGSFHVMPLETREIPGLVRIFFGSWLFLFGIIAVGIFLVASLWWKMVFLIFALLVPFIAKKIASKGVGVTSALMIDEKVSIFCVLSKWSYGFCIAAMALPGIFFSIYSPQGKEDPIPYYIALTTIILAVIGSMLFKVTVTAKN